MNESIRLHCFPARYQSLDALLGVLRAVCEAAGFSRQDGMRVELAIEELFSNTVRHGYGGESDRPVWLGACVAPEGVTVEYRDAAPAFDPLQPPQATACEAPPLGGVGRLLVHTLATMHGYAHREGCNCIRLVFARR